MITAQDLEQAIAECQGQRNPTSSTCIKLAAFYTIRQAMFGEDKSEYPSYSFAPAPETTIDLKSGSEFAETVDGREQNAVMPVIDELMSTLKVIQPRLYDAVINKLS